MTVSIYDMNLKWLFTAWIVVTTVSYKSDVHGTSCGEFRKESDDVTSQCAYVKHIWSNRRSHMTLEQCIEAACTNHANVINYLPATNSTAGVAECQPRYCDELGIMPVRTMGGWDVWRRHVFGYCRKSGFRREFRVSDGVYSDCAHLGMPRVTSFDECMQRTCDLNGTVFNIRETEYGFECAIKLCDLMGLHVVSDRGGWDIYHSQIMRRRCENRFVKLYDSSVGVASSCELRGWGTVGNSNECAHLACERRANVYNYHRTACYVESCRSPLLKTTRRHGWKLYVNGI